jgi:hypothetical protein
MLEARGTPAELEVVSQEVTRDIEGRHAVHWPTREGRGLPLRPT